MSAIFSFVLLMSVFLIGRLRKFISIVMFLVYVGGIMILVGYCVILLPSTKFPLLPFSLLPIAFLLSILLSSHAFMNSFSYGLLYSSSTVFLVALLLYLVILAIVEIVNYSEGMMKFYVQHDFLFLSVYCYHNSFDRNKRPYI